MKICPYTLTPLAQLADVSVEHIFPEALGGLDSYTVYTDRDANNEFGRTTDSRLFNSPMVRMLSVMHGVGRDPKWKLDGEIGSTGKRVEVILGQESSLQLDVKDRVVWNEDKTAATIVIPEDQESGFLAKFQSDNNRKGRHVTIETSQGLYPEINAKTTLQLKDIVPGLAKIAYLTAYRLLGDAFLSDPLNGDWLALLRASDWATIVASPVRHSELIGCELMDKLIPSVEPHVHVAAIAHLDGKVLVAVSLFGRSFVSRWFVASDTSTYELRPGEGWTVTCDTRLRETKISGRTGAMGTATPGMGAV